MLMDVCIDVKVPVLDGLPVCVIVCVPVLSGVPDTEGVPVIV